MSIEQGVKIIAGLLLVMALAGATLWWSAGRGPSAVSAQERVTNACGRMDEEDDFDFTMRFTTTGQPNALGLTARIRVSGDDFEGASTYDGQTEPYIRYARVDGTDYLFITHKNEWQVGDRLLADLDYAFPGIGDRTICPDVLGFREMGADQAQGASGVKHYTDRPAEDGVSGASTEPFEATYYDLWIDGNDQMVKHKMEIYLVDSENGVEKQITTAATTTFSGIGEANVIQAPELAGS